MYNLSCPSVSMYIHTYMYMERKKVIYTGKQTERQKDRTQRQKDGITERRKDGKTERQKDRKTERQKDRKTERQKDRKTERQKDILSKLLGGTIYPHKY